MSDLADRAADHKQLVAALKPVAANYQDAHAEAEQLASKLTDTKTLLIQATNASQSAEQQLNQLQQTQIRQQIAQLAAKLTPGTLARFVAVSSIHTRL